MTMTWIAGSTVGAGGAGNFSFGSIPQTFTHLQLRLFIRSDAATSFTYLGGYLNGDGAANYARHGLTGDGSTASSNATTGAGLWAVDSALASASLTSGIFTVSIMDLLDYRNTSKNKTMRILAGTDANGSGNVWLTSNLWLSTAAVSGITVFAGGNFIAGSRADLYGIGVSAQTGA